MFPLRSIFTIAGWAAATLVVTFFAAGDWRTFGASAAFSISFFLLGLLSSREETVDVKKWFRHVSTATKLLSPLPVAALLRYFLPRRVRNRYFEPYIEEVKEDRLIALQEKHNGVGLFLINTAFLFRLTVAWLHSLLCWASDMLRNLSPVLRWVLGTGGSKNDDN